MQRTTTLSPYEFYFKKHEAKFLESENSIYKAKLKARKKYFGLNENKKIKYIKKCEESFDEIEDEKDNLLSSILNKSELRLLFESYGIKGKILQIFSRFVTIKLYIIL